MSLEQNISQDFLKKSDIYLFEKTYIFLKCQKEVLRTKLRGLYILDHNGSYARLVPPLRCFSPLEGYKIKDFDLVSKRMN